VALAFAGLVRLGGGDHDLAGDLVRQTLEVSQLAFAKIDQFGGEIGGGAIRHRDTGIVTLNWLKQGQRSAATLPAGHRELLDTDVLEPVLLHLALEEFRACSLRL
jgi:hypothetical protein